MAAAAGIGTTGDGTTAIDAQHAPVASRRRSLGALRSSAIVRMLVGTVLAQGFLVASGILAARLLGPEDRGHLALLILPPMILGSVGGLGLPQAVGYRWAREPEGRSAVLRAVAPVAAVQGLALTAATVLLYALVLRPGTPQLAQAAALLVPGTVAILAWQYAVACAQGRQQFNLAAILLVAAPGLYVAGLLIALAAGTTHLVAIATVWMASYALVGTVGLVLACRRLDAAQGTVGPVSLRELMTFGLRAVPNLASPLQALRLDQAAVGLLLGASSLGIYVAALAVTNLPFMLAMFMSVTISGKVAAEPDPRSAQRSMRRMIGALAAASIAAAATVWLVAPIVIPVLFGEAFAAASGPARILLVGAVAAALQRSIGDGLRALGDPTASALGEIASWAVLLPALPILTLMAGLDGAAIAVVATYGTGLAVVLAQWYRRHAGSVRPDAPEQHQPGGSGVVAQAERWLPAEPISQKGGGD